MQDFGNLKKGKLSILPLSPILRVEVCMRKAIVLLMALLAIVPSALMADGAEGRGEFWYVPKAVQHPENADSFNNLPVFTEEPDLIGQKVFRGINVASGATVTKDILLKESNVIDITEYGAEAGFEADAVKNTEAINKAMEDLSAMGGGTVIVPDGLFKMYTIVLQSNVNIFLSDDAIILGARPGVDGGNYLEPEVNKYFGLQDHGHSFFRNSMIYGIGVENVMIYGEGLISGSYIDKRGFTYFTVSRRDTADPKFRTEPGYNGVWNPPDDVDTLKDQGYHFFLNEGGQPTWKNATKSIAIIDSRNIVLSGFDMREAGHFAIITEGCSNLLIENMVIDTNRDGMDIDGTSDVTIRNCWINAPLDDAICLKASFGTGRLDPTENVLIHNCVVSGYDAGSVLEGTFLENRLESDAWDARGPNGRIKLGTEATCGFDRITIAGVVFAHSEGLNLQTVDCSNLTNIIATDLAMFDVTDSPVYIQIGDRGRYPVTGNSTDQAVKPADSVRKNNPEFVLPNIPEEYHAFPAYRYEPATNYAEVTLEDGSYFMYPDPADPIYINQQNFYTDPDTGKHFAYRWDTTNHDYVVDRGHELSEHDLYSYGNALGGDFATAADIYIGNLTAVDVNPRYPIEIVGLVSSKIRNVTLENFDITYRGGITMEDAVDQRQIQGSWRFYEGHSPEYSQTIAWMATPDGRLPRVEWDSESGSWSDSPYNVPENVRDYPEPSHLGILPAYGIYARHVDGLTMSNIKLGFSITDTRPAVVLDDVSGVTIDEDSEFKTADGVADVVLVQQNYKRETNHEFVPEEPYFSTSVEDYDIAANHVVEKAVVNAPEPGTPSDSLYSYPTNPLLDEAYVESYVSRERELPRTVWRPFFAPIADVEAKKGDTVEFEVKTLNPADQHEEGVAYPVTVTASGLPVGASFDGRVFSWAVPSDAESGEYPVVFQLSDGLNTADKTAVITVL